MISKEKVYSEIQKSGNLPTLPEILLKLLEACDNENTPISEIASIISKDPVLSLKVLQLVNSAYYGLWKKFKSVEQAVVYLGANRIKNIAITTSVHQVFDRRKFKGVKRFNLRAFWYHSLLTATLAQRIAQKTGYESRDEAYLSGLLHDVGRLILVSTYPTEHESILLKTEDIQNVLWAEKQLIGVTHCEVGAWLVDNWHLDSLMADAIKYHHEPLEHVSEAFPLVKIIHLASLLSENNGSSGLVSETGELLFGLDSNDVDSIVEGATEEVLQAADDLDIKVIIPGSDESEGQEEEEPDDQQQDSQTESALSNRVRSISLLSGFLEGLVQAEDVEEVITVFEHATNILFDIEKIVLFLPDNTEGFLQGQTSGTSSLQHLSQGLTLSVQKSTSAIIDTFRESAVAYLTTANLPQNMADAQVLKAFGCSTLLLMPLVADKKAIGVALMGLPESMQVLSRSDLKLMRVVSQQVGMSLFLERMKAKKAEEIEAERMAAVSMTARKVAHEINNPLGIITNYLTTMSLKFSKDDDIQGELGIIGEEISRISSMVNQMDMFSQSAFTKLEKTDVNTVIGDLVHLIRPSLFKPADITLTFRPDNNLPKIMASRDALKQVIINLLKNAAEAMTDGGDVTVATSRVAKDQYKGGTPPADGIEIWVEDTGPGLPDLVKQNLFKPFVTTKNKGHSGLGLSIIDKTVTELGGSISCKSRPEEGTRFTIYFPVSTG